MFDKEIVIDGKGHLLGRLAAAVAKELLNGQRVVVVRAEEIIKSGVLYKNKMKFIKWCSLKSNTNPRHGGPYHCKSPARIFWRVVRGMVRHKTARGNAALEKMKVFEGMPYPYSHKKKRLIPAALKCLRLKNGRKWTRLGDLSTAIGWTKGDVLGRLEEKRKTAAGTYFQRKLKLMNAVRKTAMNLPEVKKIRAQLEKLGY